MSEQTTDPKSENKIYQRDAERTESNSSSDNKNHSTKHLSRLKKRSKASVPDVKELTANGTEKVKKGFTAFQKVIALIGSCLSVIVAIFTINNNLNNNKKVDSTPKTSSSVVRVVERSSVPVSGGHQSSTQTSSSTQSSSSTSTHQSSNTSQSSAQSTTPREREVVREVIREVPASSTVAGSGSQNNSSVTSGKEDNTSSETNPASETTSSSNNSSTEQ